MGNEHKVEVKLLFVSLDQISAVCCCPEQKPTRAEKSSKIVTDVPWNSKHTEDSKKLKATNINDSDNVTMDYRKHK